AVERAEPTGPAASSSTTAASAAAAEARPPSRRSLRERAEAATRSTEAPQERTATGRRPVVRTPSTAQGIRVIDATGQLTGIQPGARPDSPRAPGMKNFSIELDGPAQAARAAIDASPEEGTTSTEAPAREPLRPAREAAQEHAESPAPARTEQPAGQPTWPG